MSDDSTAHPLSILIVEDHDDTAQIMALHLRSKGHAVYTAGSVEAAVKNVVERRFDLIISDVGLPDGNGVSLLHGIRPFCNTPAIALTGYGSKDDIERCLRAGFDLHLVKPVSPAKLQETIESLNLSGS